MKTIGKFTSFLVISVLAGSVVLAGTWPERPVEVVTPSNPGGDTDINCRIFLKYLERELGQPMPVVNMAGAGGSIALNNVRQAKPDGYRALFFHSGALINHIMGFVDYSLPEAFEVAAMPVIDKSNCFASNVKTPYNDIKELVAYARAHPGEVSFGTESGSFTHLHILALVEASGADFNIVDAGTASEKTTALLGGRIDVIGTQYGLMKQYIDRGEIKCLGILSDQRLAGAENVTTFADSGYGLVFDKFFYIIFPKGTPKEIVDRFNAASKKVAENPDYIADCKKNFVNANYMTPDEAVRYINSQDDLYRKYEKALTGGQ
ncbi:MAG: tripartite tricarboxylate transporter substrate binding protein [Planctomycetota bacterium]|jgi:tripartite-type tricarboxylate transporter receptor subunit TctC|nr:tripartite tricarboxylate transporter substrate binding protein [Planctomycetota bacterium]